MNKTLALVLIAAAIMIAACAPAEQPSAQDEQVAQFACERAEDCTPCGDTCVSLSYAARASCPVATIEECACANRRCVRV